MKKIYLICLMVCLNFICSFAQVQLNGRIISTSNEEAIAGASILLENSSIYAISDNKGKFTITVPSLPATLDISFVGMESQKVTVKNNKTLTIILKDDTSFLDEVIVIGYGTVKKSDLTGSVSTLKGSDVNESRLLSVDQALSGKIAGVNITTTSGEPGAGVSILVRGTGSINSDCEPLYVIDGAPITRDAGLNVGNLSATSSATINPLSSLNPNDIASIEVLKDASATAIYGSRGANGVVLITTKSGTEGAPIISLNAYVGFSNVSKKIDVLNGKDWLDYMVRDRHNPDYEEKYDDLLLDSKFYNWQDELYKTAITQEYSLSVRGGTKNTKYAISGAYTDQQGTVDNSDFNRISLRARVDQNIGKRGKIGLNVSYARFSQKGVPSGGTKDVSADVFQQMLSYRPANARFNSEDLENGSMLSGDYSAQSNPKDYLYSVTNKTNNSRVNVNTYFQYEFIDGLVFKTSYNINDTKTDKLIFYPYTVAVGAKDHGRGINSWAKRYDWSWENILSYNKIFGKNHSFSAMVGYTMEANYSRDFYIETQNYPDAFSSLPGVNVGHGMTVLSPTVREAGSSLMSYLGRVNYSYKGRYLITASIRADGSSKFPKGHKFSYFPSVALAWRITEEPFMQEQKAVCDMKLRLSYGRTGNQSIPAYSSQASYGDVYYTFNESGGFTPGSGMVPGIGVKSIANPNLTWETTEQYNVGLDIGFIKNRINFSIDAYYKKTFNLLLSKPLDYTTGFSTMMYNSGSLENKGLELVLNTVNIKNRNFTWTSAFNISFNKNKVLDLGENAALTFSAGTFDEAFILAQGMPVGTMYGFVYDGVYQYKDYKNFYIDKNPENGMYPLEKCLEIYRAIANGTEKAELMDGQPTYLGDVPLPGSARFRDIYGDDNNITSEDRTYIGNSDPLFYGGFTNKFNFKNFDLSIFLQFSYGNKFLVTNYTALGGNNNRNILQRIYDNAWRPERESDQWPDYMIDTYKNSVSGLYIEDGSYLKIKDISLGYTLPECLTRKIHINRTRIYVTGQNLFTFTPFQWYDPEVINNNPVTGGHYRFKYPSSRTFIVGLSFDF